ncbi:helix-turn-helix domain-containing protein [Spongiimicrobium salis]|uniref:helix-turn-helix domain-containing protein n=1 Tax=Spongiimicrobium salis TaxID=1667022 RepID=UPI00374D1BBE
MDDLFPIRFDFWTALLLFGFFQGLLLIGILLHKHYKKVPHVLLAFLLFIITFNLLNYLVLHTKLYAIIPHIVHLSSPMLLLLGPCYYFYVKSISQGVPSFKISDFLHLIPFVLSLGIFMPFFIQSGAEKIAILHTQLENSVQELSPSIAVFLLVQIALSFAYSYYCMRMLTRMQAHNKSRAFEKKYRWLVKFSYAFLLFWAIDFIATVWYFFKGEIDQGAYYFTMLLCAVAINAIVLFALKNNRVFSQIFLSNALKKYETSKASTADLKAILEEISFHMSNENLYLDPEFSLQKLADTLGKPKYLISQVLNVELGKSFYEFVNEYRFEAVKGKLLDRKNNNLTIMAIAFDAGFNNKNTFNKVFKKHAGLTPSEFIQSHRSSGS